MQGYHKIIRWAFSHSVQILPHPSHRLPVLQLLFALRRQKSSRKLHGQGLKEYLFGLLSFLICLSRVQDEIDQGTLQQQFLF